MADDMAPGEVSRTFARHDREIKEARDESARDLKEVQAAIAEELKAIRRDLADRVADAKVDTARLERTIEGNRAEAERISASRHQTAMGAIDKLRADQAAALKDLRTELATDEQKHQHWSDTAWGRGLAIVGVLMALTTVILTAMSLKG